MRTVLSTLPVSSLSLNSGATQVITPPWPCWPAGLPSPRRIAAGLVVSASQRNSPPALVAAASSLPSWVIADDVRHAQGKLQDRQLLAAVDVPDPHALFVGGNGQPLAQLVEGECSDRPRLRGDLLGHQSSRSEVPEADIASHVARGQDHAAAREFQMRDGGGVRGRELADKLLRGKVPDLDLGLVGRCRIDGIAVARQQVAAVGRERYGRQVSQFLRIVDLRQPTGRSADSRCGPRRAASCCYSR